MIGGGQKICYEGAPMEDAVMKVHEVAPEVDAAAILGGAQFIDAYRLPPQLRPATARDAAEQMFATAPAWVDGLMRLRNWIVRPFGLKVPEWRGERRVDSVGLFPVVSQSPDRCVAGFDDKHLDFRVVVDLSAAGAVTATTLVRTHNQLGRVYLTSIMPFHRMIVRTMLGQLA